MVAILVCRDSLRLMYPTVVLMFAVLGIIGWRVSRRFGWRASIPLPATAGVNQRGIIHSGCEHQHPLEEVRPDKRADRDRP
jgi:hypothetical protein